MKRTRSDGAWQTEKSEESTVAAGRYGASLQQGPASELGTVCVVGLGYVGLPLAVHFADARYPVIGYDIDDEKVGTLQRGRDPTGDVSDAAVRESDAVFTSEPSAIAEADYVIVTVPTPVDRDERPNLEYVESAADTVGRHLTPETTVILESTVYPGATREVFIPTLEAASDLTSPLDFGVGYSPERISPGETGRGLSEVVKIVSGQTNAIRSDIADLYDSIVDAGVYRAQSIEVAEAAKVVENVQRDINIAFVNELAMAFARMDLGIDTHEVLEAAQSKWNFHDYRPGLVGGHCIPVDPYFFSQCSKRAGFVPELMLRGRQVNESMPEHVAQLMIKGLNGNQKTLRDARVLVLGLTYKANVPDVRTSKADDVADHLGQYDIDVVGYDPVGELAEMREAFDFDVLDTLSFAGCDGVLLATPHEAFLELEPTRMADALNPDPVFVDVSAAMAPEALTAAGIAYRRL